MIDIRRREEQLHLCKKIIYMTLGIYMMMISICLAGQNDNLSKETSEWPKSVFLVRERW